MVDLLVEATDVVMRELPGFVSANIHRSADGKRVVNYAQWRSAADFEAMQSDPRVVPPMHRAATPAGFDPIVCEVVDTRHA